MTAEPATPHASSSKSTRVWLIVLQVLAAPGVLFALLGALNSLSGTLMALFGQTSFPVSSGDLSAGLFSGLAYLIPPGLDLAAWLVYRKGRGGLAVTLMIFSLLTGLCAMVTFGFSILSMFV